MNLNNEGVESKTRVSALQEKLKLSNVVDDFEVMRVERIIKDIETLEPCVIPYDIDTELNKFKTMHIPKIDAKRDELTNRVASRHKKFIKARSEFWRKRKMVGFAASFIVVFFMFNFRAIAKFGWLEPVKRWASEFLQIEPETNIQNPTIIADGVKQYSEFKFVDRDYSVSIMKVNYLPEGYKLEHIKVHDDVQGVLIFAQALYKHDDMTIMLTIEPINNSNVQRTEKTDADVEEIVKNNIYFYYYENIEWRQLTWNYDNLHYVISGNIPKHEVINIIESIE